jgi:hypothetical protein
MKWAQLGKNNVGFDFGRSEDNFARNADEMGIIRGSEDNFGVLERKAPDDDEKGVMGRTVPPPPWAGSNEGRS